MLKYLNKILDMNTDLGIPAMDLLVYQDGKQVFRAIRGTSGEDGRGSGQGRQSDAALRRLRRNPGGAAKY